MRISTTLLFLFGVLHFGHGLPTPGEEVPTWVDSDQTEMARMIRTGTQPTIAQMDTMTQLFFR